jgi:sensor histidine kinase YesM
MFNKKQFSKDMKIVKLYIRLILVSVYAGATPFFICMSLFKMFLYCPAFTIFVYITFIIGTIITSIIIIKRLYTRWFN